MGTQEKSPVAQKVVPTPEPNKGLVVNDKPDFKLSLTNKELQLVKKHIAKDATDEEFALFIYDSQMRGLNPLKKEIYFIKRQNWDQKAEKYVGIASHQISIDGMRIQAEKTKKYNGQTRVEYGPTINFKGVEVPEYAEVGVYRKGNDNPTYARAYFSEYAQTFKNKKTGAEFMGAMWAKMPRHMLSKCAESLALRKAFPDVLGGIYTDEEAHVVINEVDDGAVVEVVEEEEKAFSKISNNPQY